MDCDRFREYLADVDRPGVLTREICEQVFAHAEECGDCAEMLTRSEALDSELRRLAANDGQLQAPSQLESRLIAVFRERRASRRRGAAWRYASAISIAAVLVLAIGLRMSRSRTGGGALPEMTIGKPLVTVKPTMQAAKGLSSAHATRPTPRSSARQVEAAENSRAAGPSSNVVDAENENGFIALSDVDEAAPLDDAAVVQVEMPRAALASFGLPLEAMEGGGTVRADLIVSADGTPQAIRLDSQDETGAVEHNSEAVGGNR